MKSKPVNSLPKPTRTSRAEAHVGRQISEHKPCPGDLVRHRGTGYYLEFKGHYGIVQRTWLGFTLAIGVEWDAVPDSERWTRSGHALDGLLPRGRHRCGWYVAAEDVERI